MTIIARNIAILATVGASFAMLATAQDIHTEVDVDYSETPQLREINKLNFPATLNLPAEKTARMPYSTANVRIGVPRTITTLEPVAYGDTIYTTPYRGYAALGFMPTFNAAISAGYKILDTDRTRLNAWMQYDGNVYKGERMLIYDCEPEDKVYARRHTVLLGTSLHQAIGNTSFIDAGVDYTYSHYNTPIFPETCHQGVHRLNASMLWTLKYGGLNYGLGAEYGRFAYVNQIGYDIAPDINGSLLPKNPMRENHFQVNGFFNGKFWGASSVGINVALSHNSYERTFKLVQNSSSPNSILPIAQEQNRLTTLTLNPFYQVDIDKIKLDLGAQIDLTFNAGKIFHIAPKVKALWDVSDFVKLYAKISGGSWANRLGSLYDVTPYAMPYQSFRNSQIPFEGEVGVTVGMLKGFYAELSASYAIANDWVMPQMTAIGGSDSSTGDMSMMITDFDVMDYSGYRLHGALGYNWRDIVDVKASIDIAPQKLDKGYYLWRDRAKTVASAQVRVTPIAQLDVELGWEYRGGRSVYTTVYEAGGLTTNYHGTLRSLGNTNNLTAGALYRIDSQWSAFLRGENLLNHHSLMIGGMPSQGITGLIGVTYKF